MSQNITPRPVPALLVLSNRITEGAEAYGAKVGPKQNDAAALRIDRDRLPAAQTAYLEARTEHSVARHLRQEAREAGRDCCAGVVDLLKGSLGRRWNSRWEAAGFSGGSIAISEDPLPVPMALASYLRAHPEQESESLQVTAATLAAVIAAIAGADLRAADAHTQEVAAKQARDAARTQLRRRIAALRAELTLLLSPTDGRWYAFGFRRPIDGRVPEPVTEVQARHAGEDDTIVNWPPSSKADGYRVKWRPAASPETPPVDAGLFKGGAAVIRNLPVDVPVLIILTAQNRSGESRGREIILPPRATSVSQQPRFADPGSGTSARH